MATAQLLAQASSLKTDTPYSYGKPDIGPGNLAVEVDFRFWVIKAGESKKKRVTNIEQVTWDDGGSPIAAAILTGTITTREPEFDDPDFVDIQPGDRVFCDATTTAGVFEELWQMRVYEPDMQIGIGQRTFQLRNDLYLLSLGTDAYHFVGDKSHVGGWTTREIILNVLERNKVPIGAIQLPSRSQGAKKRRISITQSPLKMIAGQLNWEKKKTQRKYALRFEKGRIYITPLRRNPLLRAIGPTLIDAHYSSKLDERFADAITLHSKAEVDLGLDTQGRRKKKHQKLVVNRSNSAAMGRYGYVHRILYTGDATTTGELNSEALEWLNAVSLPIRTLTMDHAGIPFIKRGDAIQLGIGDEGLWKQIVWVNEANHTLSTTGYTMQLSVVFDDPYIDSRTLAILRKLKASPTEVRIFHPKNNKQDLVGTEDPQKDIFGVYGGP